VAPMDTSDETNGHNSKMAELAKTARTVGISNPILNEGK